MSSLLETHAVQVKFFATNLIIKTRNIGFYDKITTEKDDKENFQVKIVFIFEKSKFPIFRLIKFSVIFSFHFLRKAKPETRILPRFSWCPRVNCNYPVIAYENFSINFFLDLEIK